MDAYSSEQTGSSMTDAGEASDTEKENDANPVFNDSNMELKVGQSEDSSASQAREAESDVCTLAQRSSMAGIDGGDNSSQSSVPTVHNYHNHSLNTQENGHINESRDIISSKNGCVYDFNDSSSISEESQNETRLEDDVAMNNIENNDDCDRLRSDSVDHNSDDNEKNGPLSRSLSEYSNHSQSGPLPHLNNHQRYGQSQSHDSAQQSIQVLSGNQSSIGQNSNLSSQRLSLPNQSLSMDIGSQAFNSNNESYEDSLSVSSYSNAGGNCYDGINIIRRTRGRPKGSKNGTGMGRARGRGIKYNRLSLTSDDRPRSPCPNYDLRNISDPFSCQRRGRPRSRFIVDLGEQNHEAWTKSKEELNISDAELTTLLLSL